MSRRALRIVNVVSLLLGLTLLVLLIVKQDAATVMARLAQAGWYFPLAFLSYVCGLLVTTAAWHQVIDPARSRATYGTLFKTFWAAHALNQVTPTGSLGEVYKVSALSRHIDGDELVASVVSFNFMSIASVQLFTLVGPLLALVMLTLPRGVIGVLLGVAVACFLPLALVYALLRLGAARKLVGLLARLPLVRLRDPERWLERASRVDHAILACRRERPARFYRAIGWFVTVRVLQIVEVWLLLIPLLPDRSVGWLLVLAALTQTATQLVAWAMAFVPGQFGVAEGASAALFGLLGLSPLVGLSMELLRRSRRIIGIAIGLIIGWSVGAVAASDDAPASAAGPRPALSGATAPVTGAAPPVPRSAPPPRAGGRSRAAS